MNDAELLTIIQSAVEASAAVPGEAPIMTMDSKKGDEGWDSLTQAVLLADLDRRLGGKLASVPKVEQAASVRAFSELLRGAGLM